MLVLGAGGAAAAVLAALEDERVDSVVLRNRDALRAQQLAVRFANTSTLAQDATQPAFDAVVNATSLGLRAGDPLPLDPQTLPRETTVLDVVYAPGGTLWVNAARACGLRAFDGGEMLLQQAVAAFRSWLRIDPPVDVMRSALTAAMQRRV